nr:retrotransposon protein [Tanacetum cinerariifolium]
MVDKSTLWHRRLGHANVRLVKNLASNELVRKLPNLTFERHLCDTCGLRNQEDCMMVVKEIENGLLKEVERSWNDGLSKTLTMKERRMKKIETRKRRFEKERKSWSEMIHHHLHQCCHPTEEMRMDDLKWWRRS